MIAEWYWRIAVGLLMLGTVIVIGSWVSYRARDGEMGKVAANAGVVGFMLMAWGALLGAAGAIVLTGDWVIFGSSP